MKNQLVQILSKPVDRREAMAALGGMAAVGLALAQTECNPLAAAEDREKARLDWEQYFQGNYRLMTD